MKKSVFVFLFFAIFSTGFANEIDIEEKAKSTLFWWRPSNGTLNFGDELSYALIQRIVKIQNLSFKENENKLLSIGSILHFARSGDVIWGSGINGKHPNFSDYKFDDLDIRAIRGPLSRQFLLDMGKRIRPTSILKCKFMLSRIF